MSNFFRIFPKFAFAASIVLFGLCLFNDGYYLREGNPRAWSSSSGLLLLGWMGLLYGNVTWLANPAMLVGWILLAMKRYNTAMITAGMALALMLSFLFQRTVISSEKPAYSEISGYGSGYWLWVASASLLLLGAIVALIGKKEQGDENS